MVRLLERGLCGVRWRWRKGREYEEVVEASQIDEAVHEYGVEHGLQVAMFGHLFIVVLLTTAALLAARVDIELRQWCRLVAVAVVAGLIERRGGRGR